MKNSSLLHLYEKDTEKSKLVSSFLVDESTCGWRYTRCNHLQIMSCPCTRITRICAPQSLDVVHCHDKLDVL